MKRVCGCCVIWILGQDCLGRKWRNIIYDVVDRFSKMVHFIHCKKPMMQLLQPTCSLRKLLGCMECYDYSLDRETQFISQFWRTLWSKLGTKLLFSTTCHPQTEVVNRILSTLFQCRTSGHTYETLVWGSQIFGAHNLNKLILK